MADRGSGKLGEDFAAAKLSEDGYQILARNFRVRQGEIDIVAQKGEYITFIEVKTRASGALATPAEAVVLKKQRKIIMAAYLYLSKCPTELQPRFDIVEVITRSPRDFRVIQYNHIEGAFDLNGSNWYD